jgi:hypothetical protein
MEKGTLLNDTHFSFEKEGTQEPLHMVNEGLTNSTPYFIKNEVCVSTLSYPFANITDNDVCPILATGETGKPTEMASGDRTDMWMDWFRLIVITLTQHISEDVVFAGIILAVFALSFPSIVANFKKALTKAKRKANKTGCRGARNAGKRKSARKWIYNNDFVINLKVRNKLCVVLFVVWLLLASLTPPFYHSPRATFASTSCSAIGPLPWPTPTDTMANRTIRERGSSSKTTPARSRPGRRWR